MLTQTDVISYLCKNFLSLDMNVIHKKIGDLNLVDEKKIQSISITVNERAIDGFFKMLEHEVSACPVVDEQGRLVTNLSASDLRGLASENLGTISLPVMQFFPTFTGKSSRFAPIVCTVEDTLDSVMLGTVKFKVHQVWIVDQQMRPIGMVTMSDMILTSLGIPPGSCHESRRDKIEHFFDTFPMIGREG